MKKKPLYKEFEKNFLEKTVTKNNFLKRVWQYTKKLFKKLSIKNLQPTKAIIITLIALTIIFNFLTYTHNDITITNENIAYILRDWIGRQDSAAFMHIVLIQTIFLNLIWKNYNRKPMGPIGGRNKTWKTK